MSKCPPIQPGIRKQSPLWERDLAYGDKICVQNVSPPQCLSRTQPANKSPGGNVATTFNVAIRWLVCWQNALPSAVLEGKRYLMSTSSLQRKHAYPFHFVEMMHHGVTTLELRSPIFPMKIGFTHIFNQAPQSPLDERSTVILFNGYQAIWVSFIVFFIIHWMSAS